MRGDGVLILLGLGLGAWLYLASKATPAGQNVIPLPSSGVCPGGYTQEAQCSPVQQQNPPRVCVLDSYLATYLSNCRLLV